MITKEQYELTTLQIKGQIEKTNILIDEQELFILDNLLDESMEEEVVIASKYIEQLNKVKNELYDSLYELHYIYNSQNIRPVPTSIR